MRFATLDDLRQYLCDLGYEDTVALEDPVYLSAIIGISHDGRLIYNRRIMARSMCRRDKMSLETAEEYIDVNVVGALPYMGEKGPILLEDLI